MLQSETTGSLVERLWASDAASALTNEAAREIERLTIAVMSVQRSAFDAGYDAARDGQARSIAYGLVGTLSGGMCQIHAGERQACYIPRDFVGG